MTDTTATAPAAIESRTSSFRGKFLLYRKVGAKVVRPGHSTRSSNPRFRHPTFAAAETEAKRLLPHHPDSTFIIMQEVGTVKAVVEDFTIPGSQFVAALCEGCGKIFAAGTGKRWADDVETCPECSPVVSVAPAKGTIDG